MKPERAATRVGDPRSGVAGRALAIARKVGDPALAEKARAYAEGRADAGALSTRLMAAFRAHRDLEAYSLLYELNHRDFLLLIAKRLRQAGCGIDPSEVLQDVFVAVFRYPNRFRDESDQSFRNWSFSILRNTVLRHMRRTGIRTVSAEPFEDSLRDESQGGPLGELVDAERREEAGFLWLLVLATYRRAFDERLNEREKRALRLVEIEGKRYREVADLLGVKVENLKMIICRARKKIYRRMEEIAGDGT